ncbi:MurR/RpiR family transcriptional regulator [Kitasatospora sp. RB6PN24]|uniref:MurR/RpiR family transcriptional regulator n=1 Tax=Kitasatospora humi TaxID=2893891 RepID=UPI001E3F8C1E|nr:MurR/RpiR family transcriptional regulator [Kitasatospora humi]MCC9306168.1 MurR/RpiR family transcriptional regulator [Kitasatospora humi]
MLIKDEIFIRMDEFTPAEKKVARVLLSDYPGTGLQSAAAVAKGAGTSTPTVLRLVARLGISSYPEFQRRLRAEINQRMSSPVSRAVHSELTDVGSPLQQAVEQRAQLVERLLGSVPPGEFERALRLLTRDAKHVVVHGGYFSRHAAALLATQLDQLIAGVDLAEEPLGRDAGRCLRLGKGSVAVVFDLRRYEVTASQLAALARQRRASVIVVTDEGLSPAAEDADVVLPVPIGGVPFDSFAGLFVLVEALVEGVFRILGTRGVQRMQQWEETVRIQRVPPSGAGLAVGVPE